MSDCAITVLHASGRRLAKLIQPCGKVIGYDSAKTFDAREVRLRDLGHLAELLRWLLPRPDYCVVRASPASDTQTTGIRRLLHPDKMTGEVATLYELPRRHIAIDVDGIPRPDGVPAADIAACAAVAIGHLPAEFHGRRCIAVATAQHGIKPEIRLRLWFWLDGAATCRTLQPWFLGTAGVDLCTFRPVQVCYTAAPVFGPGAADPIPERLAFISGAPLVPIRPPPPPPPRRERQPATRPSSTSPSASGDRYRDAVLAAVAGRLDKASAGGRHHALAAEACALFGLGSLSDGYVRQFIHSAAQALDGRGDRRIEREEVDLILDWAQEQAG